jgi:hypothetical protein
MTTSSLSDRAATVAGSVAGLLIAPLAVFAAAGTLEPASVPVALLLGVLLVAVAAYVASAVSLLERGRVTRAQAIGARPALGDCS